MIRSVDLSFASKRSLLDQNHSVFAASCCRLRDKAGEATLLDFSLSTAFLISTWISEDSPFFGVFIIYWSSNASPTRTTELRGPQTSRKQKPALSKPQNLYFGRTTTPKQEDWQNKYWEFKS